MANNTIRLHLHQVFTILLRPAPIPLLSRGRLQGPPEPCGSFPLSIHVRHIDSAQPIGKYGFGAYRRVFMLAIFQNTSLIRWNRFLDPKDIARAWPVSWLHLLMVLLCATLIYKTVLQAYRRIITFHKNLINHFLTREEYSL